MKMKTLSAPGSAVSSTSLISRSFSLKSSMSGNASHISRGTSVNRVTLSAISLLARSSSADTRPSMSTFLSTSSLSRYFSKGFGKTRTSTDPIRSSTVTKAMVWLFFVYLRVLSAMMPPTVTHLPFSAFASPVSSSGTKSEEKAVQRVLMISWYSSSGWPDR